MVHPSSKFLNIQQVKKVNVHTFCQHTYISGVDQGTEEDLFRVSDPTTRRNQFLVTKVDLNLICEISSSGFNVFVQSISPCQVQRKCHSVGIVHDT